MRNTKYFRSNYEFITADHNVIFARMIIMRTCVCPAFMCVRVCVCAPKASIRPKNTFTCKYSFHIYYNIWKLPRVVYLFKVLIWISFCFCHSVHLHLVYAQVNVAACASCIYLFLSPQQRDTLDALNCLVCVRVCTAQIHQRRRRRRHRIACE